MSQAVHEHHDPQKSPQVNLAKWIAASLALHLAASVFIFGGHHSPSGAPPITFLDLKSVQLPEMAPPAKEPKAPPQKAEPAPLPPPAVPEQAAQPERPPQKAAQPESSATPPPAAATLEKKEEQPATSLGLGMSKGYFSSIGNGETLRDDISGYYLEMLQRINEHWWLQQGDKKGIRPVLVNVVIARNGEIVTSELMMSSGNPAYDKAVLAALKAAGPLPPLPPDYRGNFFMAPIRLVPPLNLMGW